MIRIDALWLSVQPIDMRAGADRLLSQVVQVFGTAQAHHDYLFANARASRLKLLVHDGFGVWCAARRLNKGCFEWPRRLTEESVPLQLTRPQFDALVIGLPWQRLEIWGYASSEFDAHPGVVYDFCAGRGAKYPVEFLKDWSGTVVCDDYKGYEPLFKLGHRIEAGCLVHARRKFDELIKHGHSDVAAEAVRRLTWIFKIEGDARQCSTEERLTIRQSRTKVHWDKLHA